MRNIRILKFEKENCMKRRLNIGILAHVDAGKTTITEQLLLLGGSIRTAGSVDEGTAQTDWLEVERRRGISVKTACAEVPFQDAMIQLVDTPGHVDFAGEVARSLQVLDGAVLVVSGAEGVQAHTKTIFQALREMKIPTVIAVNKVDRTGFEPDVLERQVRKQLTENCVFLQEVKAPACDACEILSGSVLAGWENPENKRIWNRIFEQLADLDEELEEMYLEEIYPDITVLKNKSKELSKSGRIYPVVFLSAKTGKGIRQLAETIIEYLPDSSARSTEELQGVVFQITHDPVMGKAAHIRLFGGTLTSRDVVPIVGQESESWEKATQIRQIQGGKLLDVGQIKSGEIAAVYGLSQCKAGDIVGKPDPSFHGGTVEEHTDRGIRRSAMEIEPLLMIRVQPVEEHREMELAAALSELSEEDPLLHYERNPITRQMYLRVMGMVQIEILEELLQTRFGLQTIFSKPTVVYRETPGHMAIGREVYTMPKPCWAIVDLQIEPLPAGSGIVFESVIKEKELPYRYQNHVKASLMETFRQGIYGWEVVDAKVTLVGGQHHHVHTHPLDFFVATPVAALRALTESESVLLEPYVRVKLSAREDLMGKVLGQILSMRGEFDTPVVKDGIFILEAVLPLRDSMDYPVTFRSMTSGRGSYSMEFDSYRPCEKGFVEILPRRGVNPLDRSKWILACRSAY